ncbi:MAG: GNAT family N-acetyltransferase [Marinoscillum sp.]|uniref:GNAT family N-acetyltransferase n=1 Tax=Marinoscillum sp. TaxID=2024838 RepID=UPI0033016671
MSTVTASHLRIVHDLFHKLFYIKLRNSNAELRYVRHADQYLDFTATSVPREFRNLGIAGQLVEAGLTFAREQNMKVKTTCSYAADYVKRHPEYQDLII